MQSRGGHIIWAAFGPKNCLCIGSEAGGKAAAIACT